MIGHGQSQQREQGVVSLLTVVFFMIFISLIVVGFTTMVVADLRQTTDNDLSASALAAARSGVEDGKRILLYCQQHPSVAGCVEAINSQNDCDAFNAGKPAHELATSLSVPLSDEGEGATGGATEYEQYFTCLTIQTQTPTVSATLSDGVDYIQRLKTVTPFTELKVTWSGEGSYIDRIGTLTGWPSLSSWNSSRYMPVIRLQTIPYTSLSDLNAVEAATKTVYIVPCKTTTCPLVGGNLAISDMRSGVTSPSGGMRSANQEPIVYASCPATVGNSYTCSATLSGYDSSTSQYYVRVSALYTTTTKITLSAADSTSSSVLFDNVQPWIDATGRTNDVFKRVRAEVSYTSSTSVTAVPTAALESAAPICKDMVVTNTASSSTYNCH